MFFFGPQNLYAIVARTVNVITIDTMIIITGEVISEKRKRFGIVKFWTKCLLIK